MAGERFDNFARTLAGTTSRRQMLKVALGAAFGLAKLGSGAVDEMHHPPPVASAQSATCLGFGAPCNASTADCCTSDGLTCSKDFHQCICNVSASFSQCGDPLLPKKLHCCGPDQCCIDTDLGFGCFPGTRCPGGTCCPDAGETKTICSAGGCLCPDTGFPVCTRFGSLPQCCGQDQHCCDGACCANNWHCCPADSNHCCPPGATCTASGCVCPGGGQACADAPGGCCPPGQICHYTYNIRGRDATCCARDDTFCDDPVIPYGWCCPPGTSCPGSGCRCPGGADSCPSFESNRVYVCCPEGSTCKDIGTGRSGCVCTKTGEDACGNGRDLFCCAPNTYCQLNANNRRECVCPADARRCYDSKHKLTDCCDGTHFCPHDGSGKCQPCPQHATREANSDVCTCAATYASCHDSSHKLTDCCDSTHFCPHDGSGKCQPCPQHASRENNGAVCHCGAGFTPCFDSSHKLSACCDNTQVCATDGSGTCQPCTAGAKCGTGANATCCAANQCCENNHCVAKCSHGCCSGAGGHCVAQCDKCLQCDPANGICTPCQQLNLCCAPDGTCVQPNACPTGCCTKGVCGCDFGQTCQNHVCVCDPSACTGGCCAGGACIGLATQTDSQCGLNGQVCIDCTKNGQTCKNGTCVSTGTANCPGATPCPPGQCWQEYFNAGPQPPGCPQCSGWGICATPITQNLQVCCGDGRICFDASRASDPTIPYICVNGACVPNTAKGYTACGCAYCQPGFMCCPGATGDLCVAHDGNHFCCPQGGGCSLGQTCCGTTAVTCLPALDNCGNPPLCCQDAQGRGWGCACGFKCGATLGVCQ